MKKLDDTPAFQCKSCKKKFDAVKKNTKLCKDCYKLLAFPEKYKICSSCDQVKSMYEYYICYDCNQKKKIENKYYFDSDTSD